MNSYAARRASRFDNLDHVIQGQQARFRELFARIEAKDRLTAEYEAIPTRIEEHRLAITKLEQRRHEIEQQQDAELRAGYEVVYRIAVSSNYNCTYHGIFSTRKLAEQSLSTFPQGQLRNTTFTSKVVAIATEEIPLEGLPFRKLDQPVSYATIN